MVEHSGYFYTASILCIDFNKGEEVKKQNAKKNRGGVNKGLKKTILVIMTILMMGGLFFSNTHAEEQIPDGTIEGFDEGTYVVRNDDGDGYWEIEITDNPVITPDYTEYWSSGNFNKTVSASYYSGGTLQVTMTATFTGIIRSGGGSSIYSVSNGSLDSSFYVSLSSSCVVLRSNSTIDNPAMGRYTQTVLQSGGNTYKTFKLTLSLSYTGTATITVTC